MRNSGCALEGATVALSANRRSCVKSCFGAVFGALICWAAPVCADHAGRPSSDNLDEIMVTAKRHKDVVPDEVLKVHVQSALHDDRYFPDMHVNVTVKNGVVYLEGVVFDDWDVRNARRIAKRIPGVRRVVSDFYVPDGM
jgi:BON domain